MNFQEFNGLQIVVAGAERVGNQSDKQIFGQGWSHFDERFLASSGGVDYSLSVWNTPNQPQVNWHAQPVGRDPRTGDMNFVCAALTVEESRELANAVGLLIGEWIDRAIDSCRSDVTAEKVAREGVCVDLPNFHAARS